MKKTVKLFLLMLVAALLLSGSAFAAQTLYSGYCGTTDEDNLLVGKNLTWILDDEGTFSISGTGEMQSVLLFSFYDHSLRSLIKTVVIGDQVTSIGNHAFSFCDNLTSVFIGNSVTSIGSDAFYGCSSLTSVTIPDSVTSIGYRAFSDCSSLTSVFIGNGVTSIGEDIFYGCGSLTSIMVSDDNRNYSIDGNGILFNKDKTVLIQYPIGKPSAVYEIPTGVTSIDKAAFASCRNLTSVIVPDSVTSIGSGAFSGCSHLVTVNIPNSVTNIGEGTFSGCSSLVTVNIPNSVTVIGRAAFDDCESLTSVKLSDNITSIDFGIFWDCINLTDIFIPAGVTSIDCHAWLNCDSLTGIWVDENNAFYSSDEYGVLFNKEKTKLLLYPPANPNTSYTVPDSVTEIVFEGDYGGGRHPGAFDGCKNLTSITLTGNSVHVSAYTFSGFITTLYISEGVKSLDLGYANWNGLTEICVDENNTYYSNDQDGVLYNKDKTKLILYPGGKSDTDYSICDSVTSIEEYAFADCRNLTSITVPNSITNIDKCAFADCYSLTSITLPDSITNIDNSAFSGCVNLTSITVPDAVTSIGYNAFGDCVRLTSITIPAGVTSIGDHAFYDWGKMGSYNLADVYYSGSPTQWNAIDFGYGNEHLKAATVHFYFKPITVTLNGTPLSFDQAPIIQNDRTLVPLRVIFEALGADVAWDDWTQTVTAVKGEVTVKVTVGKNAMFKNGQTIPLDVPAQIVNDRTLVPVRAVSEAFDCSVDWDDATQTVTISA